MMYSIFLKLQESIPCMQFLGMFVLNENIKLQTVVEFQAYADQVKQKMLLQTFNSQALSMHKVMS